MSAPVYAYLTSVARYYKALILQEDDVEELLAAKDLKELTEVMNDKGIISNVQINSAEELLALLKQRANELMDSIRKLSYNSLIVKKILDIYLALLNVDEIESVISYLLYKEKGYRVSLQADKLQLFSKYADSLDSVQALTQVLLKDYPRVAEAINFAVSNKGSNLSMINSLLESYLFSSLYKLATSLKGERQAAVKKILCGYVDYYALSLAYTLHRSDLETCSLPQDSVRNVATSPQLLLDVIKSSSWGKLIKSSSPLEALNEMRVQARRNARNAAYLAFEGIPFSPAGSIAIAELIRLDYQDLVTIVTGIDARLSKTKIQEMLSFESV